MRFSRFFCSYEFLIKLTHCLQCGLWKILVLFLFCLFFVSCIYNLFTQRSGRNWNEWFGWKVFFIYARGIKKMYFYKLLVFLHIFIFAFIFCFIFIFIICSTLRNCKHALFFLSFGLLWFFVCPTPPSNNSRPRLSSLYPILF